MIAPAVPQPTANAECQCLLETLIRNDSVTNAFPNINISYCKAWLCYSGLVKVVSSLKA